jgi:hypothetical protein
MRGSQRFMRLPLVTELGEIGQVVSVVEFLQDYRDSQSIITEFSGEQFNAQVSNLRRLLTTK